MKLIVGLGNPGKEYDHTRHNVGFDMVDYYLERKNLICKWSHKFDGDYVQVDIDGEKVIFLKPTTFMNLSGNSVKKVMDYYKISIDDVLVISDDLDLLIGNFKIKANGSCGGHNGLRSIEDQLHSSFYKRLRIGISKADNMDTRDYVLSKMSKDEIGSLKQVFEVICSLIDDYFVLSFSDLMSKYNRKNR